MIIAGGGLNFYDTKKNTIRHITAADGLPSDLVVSLEKDKAGYVWIGMVTGLCRMNIFKNTFTFYNRSDGMAGDNFEISTNYQLPDGRLLFGSSNDFVVFNPQDIKSTSEPPDVSITGFKVVNNSMSVDSLMKLDKIELQANENSITISYSILSYFNKNKLVYYYMLEGIDKEWKKGNELNEAIYNYLPANTYTFKIRAENADAISSKNITTLKIKISPPFWKSWWFYALLTITCIVVFYLADRERMLRIRSTQKLRTDIALNLHHDVNTALGNINLLSEMARMKADRDIVKSKELIEQISHKSTDMMIAMDDMLWVIDPANDSMEKTILRMTEFIDALRNHHEAEIDMVVDEKVKSLKLDMKGRHGFFFIFKTALRCMVQYSGARQTLINIDLQKDGLCLKMHSEAVIKNSDSHSFACMEEMRTHAAAINAELDMQNEKGGGNIILIMPVK
jgi:Y_Y_Y domain